MHRGSVRTTVAMIPGPLRLRWSRFSSHVQETMCALVAHTPGRRGQDSRGGWGGDHSVRRRCSPRPPRPQHSATGRLVRAERIAKLADIEAHSLVVNAA